MRSNPEEIVLVNLQVVVERRRKRIMQIRTSRRKKQQSQPHWSKRLGFQTGHQECLGLHRSQQRVRKSWLRTSPKQKGFVTSVWAIHLQVVHSQGSHQDQGHRVVLRRTRSVGQDSRLINPMDGACTSSVCIVLANTASPDVHTLTQSAICL